MSEGPLAQDLFRLFCVRADTYTEQRKDGSHIRKEEPVTIELLSRHLTGEVTIGLYQIQPITNLVKWLCLDVDPQHHEDPENVVRKSLTGLEGFPSEAVLLEASRYSDPSFHIWTFFDPPIEARYAKALGEILKKKIGESNLEVFPKQTEVGEGEYGNLVKLPLGLHQSKGKWSRILDKETFKPLPSDLSKVKGCSLSKKDELRLLEARPELRTGKQKYEPRMESLRPCLQAMVKLENPGALTDKGHLQNKARMALVTEALDKGFGADTIAPLFSAQLDYKNGKKSQYHVRKLVEAAINKGIHPWSCDTLIKEGWCTAEDPNQCHVHEVYGVPASLETHEEGEPTSRGHDPFRYFSNPEKGRPKFLYDVMIQDILKEYTIITFTDIEDSWIYDPNNGIYRDTAITTVKKFMMRVLGGVFFKKSYAEETIYQIKVKTYVTRGTMDPPEELLNLENGILDITTRTLSPHNKKWFFTNCLPTQYDPNADAPIFKALLEFIECKKEVTLQEFCGYFLNDSPKYKKAGFIHGPTDSLKTTFTNAIMGVLGSDVICSIPIQRIDRRFQAQRLYKKKANICGDLGAEAFSYVSMFRRTVGGDSIEAEIKGKNKPLTFIWNGKHLFDANDLPEAKGDADTDAFYNRLLLFPFSKQIKKKNIDRTIPAKLASPEERSGILNWMLDGLDRLEKQKKFTDETSIDEIRDHYKRAADSVYCFAQDCCKVEEGTYTAKSESHRAYVAYCIEQGFSPKGRSKFYEELQTKLPGIKTDRRKVGTETPQVWMNLKMEHSITPTEPTQEKL